MRRIFSGLKDQELRIKSAQGNVARQLLDEHFTRGVVQVDEVLEASKLIEEGLVARAIGRMRMLLGGRGSHKVLRGSNIEVNPKKEEAIRGERMSERRRI